MTKELSKTELTRMAWITELRRQGHRQCDGAYFRDDQACALGLLAEVAGIGHNQVVDLDLDPDEIGARAGLRAKQVDSIVSLNDGLGCRKHTFSEIADIVDGWFQ